MTSILIYCFFGLKMWLAPVKDFLMIQHVQTPGILLSVWLCRLCFLGDTRDGFWPRLRMELHSRLMSLA